MIFGVDYYPEHWDRQEWEKQAKQMKECGFNTVRMGEFGWKLMEWEEGKFDFSLFDDAIELLAKYGIKTILGTPTAAPPQWLVKKYDVLQRDKYRRPLEWGSRRECCANSSDYVEKSKIIVTEMVKHYKDNDNVIGWQIDNEFGCHESTRCYCDNCRKAFGKWLSGRYKDVDELNKKWGTSFWSLQYDSFDDVILPQYNSCDGVNYNIMSHNPSLELEYRRFASDSWVQYQNMQIDIIKKYTDKPVTHNMMGHFSDINYRELGKKLDYVSWDNYPDNQWGSSDYEYVSMAHETMRGIKDKDFVVMEEQAGPCGWDIVRHTPRPGQLRLWVYQAIAHGACGIVYFRFKTALFGMEQYWYGVLDYDGIPGRRYNEIQKTGQELVNIEKNIFNKRNNYDALIVKSYDNSWSHDIKRHVEGYNYGNHIYSFYKALADLNINTTVGGIDDIDKYKIVCMPAYNVTERNEVEKTEEYVKAGGTVILTFRSGTRDEYNNMQPLTVPGVFARMAGIEVKEFDAPYSNVRINGVVDATARLWCDIITPVTAKVLCTYADEYYKGKAAVTVNEYGKGKVYYVGCDLDDNAMKLFIEYVAQIDSVRPVKTVRGVEVVKREDIVFVLNHNSYTVDTGITGVSLIDGRKFDGNLEGYGVEVLSDSL